MVDHSQASEDRPVRSALDDAAELAREQAEAATRAATHEAEAQASNAAQAAEAASSEFESGSTQAAAADQIATHLQEAASVLRDTDFSTVASKATSFARENPMLVLGGAALLGFAAARFLNASDPESPERIADDTSDPWTGHVTATSTSAPVSSPARNKEESYPAGRIDR